VTLATRFFSLRAEPDSRGTSPGMTNLKPYSIR
jgi:hypothetical protein